MIISLDGSSKEDNFIKRILTLEVHSKEKADQSIEL